MSYYENNSNDSSLAVAALLLAGGAACLWFMRGDRGGSSVVSDVGFGSSGSSYSGAVGSPSAAVVPGGSAAASGGVAAAVASPRVNAASPAAGIVTGGKAATSTWLAGASVDDYGVITLANGERVYPASMDYGVMGAIEKQYNPNYQYEKLGVGLRTYNAPDASVSGVKTRIAQDEVDYLRAHGVNVPLGSDPELKISSVYVPAGTQLADLSKGYTIKSGSGGGVVSTVGGGSGRSGSNFVYDTVGAISSAAGKVGSYIGLSGGSDNNVKSVAAAGIVSASVGASVISNAVSAVSNAVSSVVSGVKSFFGWR